MRIALGIAALLAAGTALLAQDLAQPLDTPGELVKELPGDAPRTAGGLLPLPPPPPARPELNAAIERADAAAIRKAWLRTQESEIRLLSPGDETEWTEGQEVELTWETSGPVEFVRIYYYGGRCRLGGRDRGQFEGFITEKAPNTGRFAWKMPWVDALSLGVRIAALGEDGGKLAADEGSARFRPKFMAELREKGTLIAISKTRQRLYYQRDGKLVRQHIISTAAGGYWTPIMKPGSYDGRRGAMGRVFGKSPNAWSSQYHCWMPYWMAITASGSHGIHATSPPFYHALGGPASHGCVRQHRADARVLYGMVSVGTPVYVFA
ncbi:MAG: L,D-transpeptidase [Armatimonadetes bacterium]|nr:L,D-transpeptidase [Armatimonadota bacterium]